MKKAVLVTNMIEAVRSKSNAGGFVKPYKNGQYEFEAGGADHRVSNRSIKGRRNNRPSATQMANNVFFDERSSPLPLTKKKALKVDATEALQRCCDGPTE
jgi:hypothetical protein